MKLDFSLNMVQEQKLVMTQQNATINKKFYKMSTYDLREYIENENFQKTPILEWEILICSKKIIII